MVWREQEAVDMVTGLNAPASSGAGGYSWQTVWVAGLDGEVSASLTPDDRDLLKLAGEHDALGTERRLACSSVSSSTCQGRVPRATICAHSAGLLPE